ncbi:glycoside hydrolase [Paraflavitalea soli]|uniref:beta-N-acetylhexosaminidase n=1 Tax=Paraflavitalea soli TaxID=2315862 RepID=A0A3B7MKQ8_9BACT|nr:glycoside hydrolase family 20 zincin-like fold domain-containing protein [Paraflavitalea soli]AXY74237.1 glycoside hydrolase [Paraflavitalea soli]
MIGKTLIPGLFFLLLLGAARGNTLPVLPYPQQVTADQGALSYPARLRFQSIGINAPMTTRLTEHWNNFAAGLPHPVAGTATVSLVLLGKNAQRDKDLQQKAGAGYQHIGQEGYVLIMNEKERTIAAHTEAGLFYGLQTLKQLTRGGWNKTVSITDWPAFATRVIYDDISRGPISTVAYVKQQIERMAELKINYLSFYIEHVVQPVSYPDFAPANGKLTIAQIKELSAHAAKYHMQLIGSFQSFGHFDKILALPQYRSMGETNTLISPLDPKAREFLEKVIGELCDAFSAPWFNVNCDETFDLNKGRSKAYIDSIGPARFYSDHMKFLYDVVTKHHKKMMMWGDIALQYKEIPDMLPRDIIYLTWEYSDQPSYARWIQPFADRKLEFMVCPGILNSYRLFPDMVMAKGNIAGFLAAGKQQGATGAFTTIWDDGSTYLFSGDWYGVYAAAEKSWNIDTLQNDSFDSRYEINAYGTRNGGYVKALFKLMELRGLKLTYNLNELLWQQVLLPEKGKKMLLNNTSVPAANAILQEASTHISRAAPLWHKDDVHTLQHAIEQYQIIMDTRTTLVQTVKQYQEAQGMTAARPQESKVLLLASARGIHALASRYVAMKDRYRAAWKRENQDYWLKEVLLPYDKKIADLHQLEAALLSAAANTGKQAALPPADSLRLTIAETRFSYFQNWMLTGPFPGNENSPVPAFLYAENNEYNKPPSPGDFTMYQGKTYRWHKFATPNGGIIDLEERFGKVAHSSAYAYCNITAKEAAVSASFLSAPAGAEVFFNGMQVMAIPGTDTMEGEKKYPLPFKAGINHLLLKIPQGGSPWQFTFRLAADINVINSKHKYQTNPQNKVYEAE